MGTEVTGGGGGGGRLYPLLRCHHQNDSCILMCGDESYFNVSFIVRHKVMRRYMSITHNFWRRGGTVVEWNCGPPAYKSNILPLGQTSSLIMVSLDLNGAYVLREADSFGTTDTSPILMKDVAESVSMGEYSWPTHPRSSMYWGVKKYALITLQ